MATADEIRADIAELRAARLSLAKGERVTEVWRDGRRLTFGTVTLNGLGELIDALKCDLSDAEADANDQPHRRAIGLRYTN